MKKGTKNQGFTLVELMVVLVIIGILATMAIPKFLGATNKTKAAECKPVLKEIYTLQSAFHIEKDSFAVNNTTLGFVGPDGSPRYTYTAARPASAGDPVGTATLNAKLGDAAANDKASIDSVSVLTASAAALAGYLNVAVK